MGHLLMENRSGLVVAAQLTRATGRAEREAASRLIGRCRAGTGSRSAPTGPTTRRTSSPACAALNATPHVAQNLSGRSSRIDRRTVRHPGYLASQRARKRIEEAFAWIKTIAGQAKTSFAAPPGSAGPSRWRRRPTT